MTDNLDDKWFADKFISISEDLGGIKESQENQDKALTRAFKKLNGHSKRIRTLERSDAVQKNILQRNPVKTGVAVGTVSLGTIITIAGFILKVLGVV